MSRKISLLYRNKLKFNVAYYHGFSNAVVKILPLFTQVNFFKCFAFLWSGVNSILTVIYQVWAIATQFVWLHFY